MGGEGGGGGYTNILSYSTISCGQWPQHPRFRTDFVSLSDVFIISFRAYYRLSHNSVNPRVLERPIYEGHELF